MSRLTISFFILMFLCAGCGYQNLNQKFAMVDSLIVAEQYDSAHQVLMSIDSTITFNQEDKAHYYLLLVQTSHLIDHPLSSDSLLDIVIKYYQDGTDATKLSDAYYYKAVGLYQKAAPKEVILYLKKAEEQAELSGNIRQQYKISEGISFINSLYGNYDIQLEYAKKMINLSKVINNKRWIADAYFRASLAYSNLGIIDSIKICTDELSPYIKYVREKDLPYFLSGIGFVYKESNPNIAKSYFQRALSLKEMPMALSSLAEICYDEGNKQEAYHLWQRALATDDPTPKDNIIQNLIEYEIETGKIDSISDRVNEIIAIRDSVEFKIKNNAIRDLQIRYDHEVQTHKLDQQLNYWRNGVLLLIIVLLLLTMIFLRKKHLQKIKEQKRQMLLQEQQLQICDYLAQIEELKKTGKDCEEEIAKLNLQIINYSKGMEPELQNGFARYVEIEAGNTTLNWKDKDYSDYNSYYGAIDFWGVYRIKKVKRADKMTPYRLFYLILKHQGRDDEQIKKIMIISQETLRSYRIRTKPI